MVFCLKGKLIIRLSHLGYLTKIRILNVCIMRQAHLPIKAPESVNFFANPGKICMRKLNYVQILVTLSSFRVAINLSKWMCGSAIRDVNVSLFLLSNISFFFTPLKKKLRFVSFLFEIPTKKNVFKYFNIELVTIYGGSIRY